MRKTIILYFVVFYILTGYSQNIPSDFNKNIKQDYILNEDVDSSNVTSPFKVKVDDDNYTFTFCEGSKSFKIKSVGMRWDSGSKLSKINRIKARELKGDEKIRNTSVILFDNLYSEGISLKSNLSKFCWKKVITIDSLECLKNIPDSAKYLEFIYELENNFKIKNKNGEWNGNSEFVFDYNLPLSDSSILNKITVSDADTSIVCSGEIYFVHNKSYIKKKIPVSFLKSATYPVSTDFQITFGEGILDDEMLYGSYADIAALTENKFIYLWRSTYGVGYCKLGHVDGESVAYDTTAYNWFHLGADNECVSRVTDSTFIFVFEDFYSGSLYANVGKVSSDNVITFGNNVQLNFHMDGHDPKVIAMSDTSAIVVYNDDYYNQGESQLMHIDGTTISLIQAKMFYPYKVAWPNIAKLTDTSVVITFKDRSDLYSYAVLENVGQSSLQNEDRERIALKRGCCNFEVHRLSDSTFVTSFNEVHDRKLYNVIGKNSSGVLSIGSLSNPYGLSLKNTDRTIVPINSNTYIHTTEDSDFHGSSRIATVTGTTISYGEDLFAYGPDRVIFTFSIPLTSDKYIISYINNESKVITQISTIHDPRQNWNNNQIVRWNNNVIKKINNR